MHSRPAEAQIAVMSGPVPRSPAARAPVAQSRDRFARAIPRVAGQSEEVDACLYIFALCKHLQTTCLDRGRIDCLIDGDGAGRLPETVCRMLGLMVCELVKDASERTIAPRTVTVTLRRRGAICLCTISGQGMAEPSADPRPGLRRVRQLAAELHGGCMIRSMPDRGTIAIMFDARLVEPRLPAAIWRYRASAAVRRAVGYIPAVLE
jgi:two-component sensor histidine kinase